MASTLEQIRQPRSAVRAMAAVWLAWTALMASANLAAPLYAVYADRFSFSSLVLTLVFSTYAAVLAGEMSFTLAVGSVVSLLAAVALATAGWQLARRG